MKFIKYISVVAITILFLLFSARALVQLFAPEPTVIQSVQSPDGKYTAYVYESNGGATTGFIYHLSILKTGGNFPIGRGNVYMSKTPVNVVWVNSRELHVNNVREIAFKQKEAIMDIKITYDYLEK